MKIAPFKLERYFARYEFSANYLLSSSDCDGFSLPYVLDAANDEEKKLWNELKLGYTESSGRPLLRETIAKQYKNIKAEDVLVASPGEINFMLMNVLLEAGDDVVCAMPAYQSLYQVAKSVGANIIPWKPVENNWYYNPADLEKLITPKTKLIIINFPHNPTGHMPAREDWIRIIDIARKRDIYLFSDEMYWQLWNNIDLPPACDVYEKAISLWGMAKSFALAGLRLGWMATKSQHLLQEMLSYKDYLTICNNAISEVLSIVAINQKEKFINPNIDKINHNVEVFTAFEKKYADLIEFTPPKAGSIAFVKLKLKESTLNFCERLVKDSGIMLLPSEMFEYGDKHVRVGFGRSNFEEALGLFEKYLVRNYNRQ